MPEIQIALKPANPDDFSGVVYTNLFGEAEKTESIKLYYVHFEPGGRTNWHRHSGPQILVVKAGRCRYQREGEPIREAGAGESVRFEPGIKHWHGATPTEFAQHIAINLNSGETEWLEPVAQDRYAAQPG